MKKLSRYIALITFGISLLILPACDSTDFGDIPSTPAPACSDNIDNDGDTLIDVANDPGCSSATDTDELGTNECDDGIDNDGDTFIDSANDPGCIDAADASELGIPTLAGFYQSPVRVVDVFVVGNYAYVVDDYTGLGILDISNPASPTLVGFYDPMYYADAVFVSGNYAYLAADWSGLHIIDVTDPSAPTSVSVYSTAGCAEDVFVQGNYAYIGENCGVTSEFEILDISNPNSPTRVGSAQYPYGLSVYVSGDYAYLATGSYLVIIGVSTPSSPTWEKSYDTPSNSGVFVDGNYAYVASGSSGVLIVDVSTPSSPNLISSFSSYAFSSVISGAYAFVGGGELEVFNISDLSSPQMFGIYEDWDIIYNMSMNGNYIFAADMLGGLVIIYLDTDPSGVTECNDLIDNDGDTLHDYHFMGDPGCTSFSDNSE